MKSNKKDSDVKVDDIKDILEQLQSLSISENSVVSEKNENSKSSTDDKAHSKKKSNKKLLYISLSLLALCVSGAGGYIAFFYSNKSVIQAIEEKQVIEQKKILEDKKNVVKDNKIPAAEEILIVQSKKLIQEGKIISARKLLLSAVKKSNYVAEIPFLLAQTYDPNFLRDLQSSDADAELSEAKQWYLTWYEVALKGDNPPSPERLEQILSSLR